MMRDIHWDKGQVSRRVGQVLTYEGLTNNNI